MSRQLYSLSINEFSNCLSSQRNWYKQSGLGWWWQQNRYMATSRRVQDRSRLKRVHDLEVVIEKWKISSKILFLMETLKKEPEQIVPMRYLDQHQRQINLPKPYKISDFLRKSPKLFDLYKDKKCVLLCGVTKEAEDLVQEEERILEGHTDKAAEFVTRFLMMSVDKRLPLDKIAHFRRDMGLPHDFRTSGVHSYPQHFRVVKSEDAIEYLELVSWNPAWAITELEKKVLGENEVISGIHTPGMLSLPFPMKFPPDYKKVYRYGGKIDHFQKRSYLSPYADARGLKTGCQDFDKRAIAVIHEVLSFTIAKRLVTDHLTHFRWEFVMPQKLMRLLLKHFGIFYVSERSKRFSVFLTEAYEGSELIQKNPLVLWREKVQRLIGYTGKKKKIETFSDMSDKEDYNLYKSDSEDVNMSTEHGQEELMDRLEDASKVTVLRWRLKRFAAYTMMLKNLEVYFVNPGISSIQETKPRCTSWKSKKEKRHLKIRRHNIPRKQSTKILSSICSSFASSFWNTLRFWPFKCFTHQTSWWVTKEEKRIQANNENALMQWGSIL